MSDFSVDIVKIEVLSHPNADKLQLARIGGEGGYISVIGLNQFKDGDLAIYVPPDSLLPQNIMDDLAKNKITMSSNRLKAVKIRGVLSEGLCLSPSDWLSPEHIKSNKDVSGILGITKYEPKMSGTNIFKAPKGVNNYKNNNFIKYDCISHFKKYPSVLKENEEVVITIKWHGSNHRAGVVNKNKYKKKWWHKLLYLFVKETKKEFLVGSHNTIRYLNKWALKNKSYEKDLYWRAALKYKLEDICNSISQMYEDRPDVIIYSEIIGAGIQQGYSYSIKEGDVEIRVFDIMINKSFVDWKQLETLCHTFNLPMAGSVYVGPWNLELLKLAETVDEYSGKKYNREGIVIKPITERTEKCGRVALKFINPEYLLDKKNTDYH